MATKSTQKKPSTKDTVEATVSVAPVVAAPVAVKQSSMAANPWLYVAGAVLLVAAIASTILVVMSLTGRFDNTRYSSYRGYGMMSRDGRGMMYDDQGPYQDISYCRGDVTAVDTSSITVNNSSCSVQKFTLSDNTVVVGARGALKVGDKIVVTYADQQSSATPTALRISVTK
jgi:hypothetical protein